MSGGGGAKPPAPYQPMGQSGADAGYLAGTTKLSNVGAGMGDYVYPQLQGLSTNIQTNPYFPTAMQGVSSAADVAKSQVAPMQLGASSALNTAGLQALATGFDPQQALYNRNYQQNLDQNAAIAAMSGVSGTPYGAGVMGDAARNFNIDWQNQQLARQLQALSGYGGAAGEASALGTEGLNTMAGAAQLPYDLYTRQQQAGLGALGQLANITNQAYAPQQSAVSDYGNYMSLGQNANALAQQRAQMIYQQQADQAAGIGNLLGNLFGNTAGSLFSMGRGGSGAAGASSAAADFGGPDAAFMFA